MTTKMKMKGNWEQAKGEIKEAWGQLTDHEVERAEGNWDQLVGTIREKTGEGIEEVESKLDAIIDAISEPDRSTDTSS